MRAFELDMKVPGINTQEVRHVFLGLVFNYTLSDVINVQMQSMALIDQNFATGVSHFESSGSLTLHQS